MNDLREQLPKCPLEYQVPHIPSTHTAIVIDINTDEIEWQERMLPWTLASLINNTDIVMKGVHLYIRCEAAVKERIEAATAKIEIQNNEMGAKDNKIIVRKNNSTPLVTLGYYGFAYDSVCLYDINYWAFRNQYNTAKLPFGHLLRHNWGWGAADYSLHDTNETHLIEAGERAHWLHDTNTAVYGENYKKRNVNVAAYFFNETEPNWHLDVSLLQYPSREANDPKFIEWATEWKHLGQETLIALWLLKTHQHAYNFDNSLIIKPPVFIMESSIFPRLFNMQFATTEVFREAIKRLTGAHVNIAISN